MLIVFGIYQIEEFYCEKFEKRLSFNVGALGPSPSGITEKLQRLQVNLLQSVFLSRYNYRYSQSLR
jgi:hypothetical protein